MRKLYLAYGSNLSLEQMAYRCPHAYTVGTATLPDYQLLFKGSKTGSYLTVEPKRGYHVPLLVWSIDEKDELMLDRYEGYPDFYYKKELPIKVCSLLNAEELDGGSGIIYIMHEERHLGCPTNQYFSICYEGYLRFGFDPQVLRQAVLDSAGDNNAKRILGGRGK